jgi:hypothetical protein
VSQELRVEAHRLAVWWDEFIASGTEGLKERPAPPEDRRLREASGRSGAHDGQRHPAGRGQKKGAPDPAQEAEEVSAEVGAPISRVCVVLEAPRSTVHALRGAGYESAPAAKRGPKPRSPTPSCSRRSGR